MVAQILVTLHMFYLRQKNKLKERVIAGEMEDERRINTGDCDIHFKYRI